MKWFRMDSDTPNHPTSRRVIKRLGNEGFGGLVRLWCFTAQFGKDEPGRCVDSDSDPFRKEDLLDASGLNEEAFSVLIEVCLETKCADRVAWEERGELAFPGMASRSDNYSKKIRRTKSIQGEDEIQEGSNKNQKSFPTVQDTTVHEKRVQGKSVLNAELLRDEWNRITAPPIPKCKGLSKKRIAAVALRVAEHGTSVMTKAFEAISESGFCRGENERGWVATFDWVLKPDVPLRALEGKYANRGSPGKARSKVSGKYDKVERGTEKT